MHYGPSAAPYQQPATGMTYQQPATGATYQQPATSSTYQQPSAGATYQQPGVPAAVATSWGGPASYGVQFPAAPRWHDPSNPNSGAMAGYGAEGKTAAPAATQRHAHSSGAVPWGGRSPAEHYMM